MSKKTNDYIEVQVSEDVTADLRGRQSVRTTFKLSERSIDALSILAGQLGIKQKSLFDHLIEDTQTLQRIAREFEDFGERASRVAKTYVISRKTLENLEKISSQFNTPRDALVEFSIERILPLVAREKEKHQRRKRLSGEVREYLSRGRRLLVWAERELGEEDPVTRDLRDMLRTVRHCHDNLEKTVARGNKIEDF